jgi:hypothetical protein
MLGRTVLPAALSAALLVGLGGCRKPAEETSAPPNTALAASRQSAFSSTELAERTMHRSAVEAVIWGMPAVNAQLMFQAMRHANADFNQVVYWSRPVSWKNQTLTPNPDTIYLMPFYNTKDAGPMVLEIPPAGEDESITGSTDDAWQTALEDVGPAGVDKGKGREERVHHPVHAVQGSAFPGEPEGVSAEPASRQLLHRPDDGSAGEEHLEHEHEIEIRSRSSFDSL